jgi:hypothetical protein
MASDDCAATTTTESEFDSIGGGGRMSSKEGVTKRLPLSPPSPSLSVATPVEESIKELDRMGGVCKERFEGWDYHQGVSIRYKIMKACNLCARTLIFGSSSFIVFLC